MSDYFSLLIIENFMNWTDWTLLKIIIRSFITTATNGTILDCSYYFRDGSHSSLKLDQDTIYEDNKQNVIDW